MSNYLVSLLNFSSFNNQLVFCFRTSDSRTYFTQDWWDRTEGGTVEFSGDSKCMVVTGKGGVFMQGRRMD